MIRLNSPECFVAIDWSGSATAAGQRRHIVLASWKKGAIALRSGYTRHEVGEWLIATAAQHPHMVVGLDFAFAFPAWWMRAQGCPDAFALWSMAEERGERWLGEGCAPFWGRPGQPRPDDHCAPGWLGFRRTDRVMQINGCSIRPKSPFQIGGAGAVGTGSIRGMPLLRCLHQSGFHIWPFDPPELPLVMEIYPRLFTGAVVKSDPAARAAYLRRPAFSHLPGEVLTMAAASEDAFDALCSVLGMVNHAEHLHELELGDDDQRMEGAIWTGGICGG